MIIYKITNKINGKSYIGQTSLTLSLRWRQHCQHNRKRPCPLILAAIIKYGPENFSVEVLENCNSKESLNQREKYWVKFFDSFKNGYNLTSGGNRVEISEESKLKISKALTGRPSSRKGIPSGRTAWNKGKPWSLDMRKKLSVSHRGPGYIPPKGWKMSAQGRLNLSAAKKGKPRPDLIGRKYSEESKIKMSLAKIGKRLSPGTEFKLGEGTKSILNIDTGEIFKSLKEASIFYGCDRTGLSKCVNGIIKTSSGFRWKFYNPTQHVDEKNSIQIVDPSGV